MIDWISFDYCIEYNIIWSNSCEESGCIDERICRCSTIENIEIKGVNVDKVSKMIYKTIENDRDSKINEILYDISVDMDLYTINRTLNSFKIWEQTNWDIRIIDGYYGQEIDGEFIDQKIIGELKTNINEALNKFGINERVEYLLEMEYGELLPELIGLNYEIGFINKSDIIFGSKSHKNIVDKKSMKYYSDNNYDGIRGVVIDRKDGKYRLIDGYHRCSSTNKDKIKVIIAK